MALLYFKIYALVIVPWLSIPPLGRTGIRLIAAIAIGYLLARRSGGLFKTRPANAAFVVALLFILPFLGFALADYPREKVAFQNEQCRKSNKASLSLGTNAPLKVDGFLVSTDFDDLMTKTGVHNLPPHRGRLILDASTFDDMAQIVLMDWKYSFVEFEMNPPRDVHGYSNAGLLDTRGWSGKRYRLYYIAPRGHPNCVQKLMANSKTAAKLFSTNSIQPQELFCLAMEITVSPVSQYRFISDDFVETVKYSFHTQGFKVPAWTDTPWERIEVSRLHTGEPIARWLGINRLANNAVPQRCGNVDEARKTLASALAPDSKRTFFQTKSWYSGSTVQKFYESSSDMVPKGGSISGESAPRAETASPSPDERRCVQSRERVQDSSTKFAKISCTVPSTYTGPALHVISIYEGTAGNETVQVNVSDDRRPLVLAFEGGKRIHWKVNLKSGVRVSKVLLGGGSSQRVSGIPPNTPIEVYTYEPSPCEMCWQGPVMTFGNLDGSHLPKFEETTGLKVTSFQGRYRASEFSISPSSSDVQLTQTTQIDRKSQLRAKSGSAPALHVIGIHEGGEIKVNVTDDSRPIILGLTAYNKTHWNVSIKSGVKILKVILGGYHAQRVSGLPPETLIETYTHDPSPCERCSQGSQYFYSFERPPEQLRAITGLDPISFQGRYEGREFSIFPGMKRVDD